MNLSKTSLLGTIVFLLMASLAIPCLQAHATSPSDSANGSCYLLKLTPGLKDLAGKPYPGIASWNLAGSEGYLLPVDLKVKVISGGEGIGNYSIKEKVRVQPLAVPPATTVPTETVSIVQTLIEKKAEILVLGHHLASKVPCLLTDEQHENVSNNDKRSALSLALEIAFNPVFAGIIAFTFGFGNVYSATVSGFWAGSPRLFHFTLQVIGSWFGYYFLAALLGGFFHTDAINDGVTALFEDVLAGSAAALLYVLIGRRLITEWRKAAAARQTPYGPTKAETPIDHLEQDDTDYKPKQ